MFTSFYVTNKGNQYIAKSMEGKTLEITKGQYGSGTLPEGTVVVEMTALVEPIADMQVSKQNSIGNCIITETQFSNKVGGAVIPPFYFMEAGIFGRIKNADGTIDPDGPEALLFYANALTQDKADYIPGTLTEFIINWPLTITGSENITVTINDSLIYVTKKDFNQRAAFRVTAGGTDEALTVDIDGETLKDGMPVLVTLAENLKAYSTISFNGGTAYPIHNPDGSDVKDGQQVAGSTMQVIYSATGECWYVVGGGGGSVEIATEAEAKAGTNNTKMMTPLRVANYVDNILGDVNSILDTINGEVV